MDDRAPSMLKPTLIGGMLFGVLSGIPIIEYLNCACCALVIGGGFFAAYLYSKSCAAAGVPFGAREGGIVGLIAALFYAVGSSVIGALKHLVWGRQDLDEVMAQLESSGLPQESMEMVERFMGMLQGPLGIFILFLFTLLLAAIFSTIGGLIGAMVFKVTPPARPPMAGPVSGMPYDPGSGGGTLPPAP